ncbi:hypothetical protein GCM10022226_50720 [Sphaerisporangium flaviroseum]|uniref:Uncharacterized protein n=1 Tax=Sphaerisporangium flaviroseum TaxID=509199 RepID=A0ABP7IQ85_9ACTN
MSVPVIRTARPRFRTRTIRTPLNAVLFLNRNEEDAVVLPPRVFLAVATARQRPEGYHRFRPTGGLKRHTSHRAARPAEAGGRAPAARAAGVPGAPPPRRAGAGGRDLPRRPGGSTRRLTPLGPETPRATTTTTSLTAPLAPATGVRGRTLTDRITGRSGPGGAVCAAGPEAATVDPPGDGGAFIARPAKEGGASARTVSAASPAADDVSKRLMVMAWRLGTEG